MVTPGEIGVYEGTMVGVFALFGIPLSTGFSSVLVDYFVRASITRCASLHSEVSCLIRGKYAKLFVIAKTIN